MLYWIFELTEGDGVFNLFRYITFRAGAAFFTALIFGFLFGRRGSARRPSLVCLPWLRDALPARRRGSVGRSSAGRGAG